MIIRPAAERPMILSLAFLNWEIVDARNSKPGKPMLIVFPILISVGTEPVAAIVMALIGETHSDPVLPGGPDFFNEAVVKLARPFAG
jgi:hypothetical protein